MSKYTSPVIISPPSLSPSKAEQETQSLSRKLKLLEEDLDAAEDRLQQVQQSLKEHETLNDELTRENKQLHRAVEKLEGGLTSELHNT